MSRPAFGLVTALVLSLSLAACGGDSKPDSTGASSASVPLDAIVVTSDAFGDGEPIPLGYSCDGTNTSPPLQWTNVPSAAKALALVVSDPDAPGGTFYHWIVTDIPASTSGVDAGTTPEGVVAQNSAGDPAYLGPCPPSGTHHYRFTLYALSQPIALDQGTGAEDALAAITADAASGGTLVGTFTRG